MKVLVSDQLGEIGIRMFQEEEGLTVDVKTGLPPEELKKIIGEYHALVIRSATKVTADLMGEAKNLKVVGRAGIGLDNVDIPTATKHGIIVMNTPTGNVITTAEHAIWLCFAMTPTDRGFDKEHTQGNKFPESWKMGQKTTPGQGGF